MLTFASPSLVRQVKIGDVVKEGDQLAVLSAMKMESVIPAKKAGTVTRVTVNAGDNVDADDLIVVISDEAPKEKSAEKKKSRDASDDE